MRIVAALLALSCLMVIFPFTHAADECQNTRPGDACVPIDASRPGTPPPAPGVVDTPYWGGYYLWVGAATCTTAVLNDCRGTPPTSGSGVPLPQGGQAGVGQFGMLFKESNGRSGLQRTPAFPVLADRMILV